jgi:transcriptional regulator with XRE-family HTH domain
VARRTPLSDRLRDARIERRKKQHQLASLIGVATRSIEHYESGNVVPSDEMLVRLAGVLDVPYQELHELAEDVRWTRKARRRRRPPRSKASTA